MNFEGTSLSPITYIVFAWINFVFNFFIELRGLIIILQELIGRSDFILHMKI